jgi:hypothetical protein
MTSPTEALAKWIWFQILMGSRRSRNRARVTKLFSKIPPAIQGKVRRQVSRQERFARRYAVVMLKVTLNLALCSVVLTLALIVSTYLQEQGLLQSPFAPK